jgi:hypothetical protein
MVFEETNDEGGPVGSEPSNVGSEGANEEHTFTEQG